MAKLVRCDGSITNMWSHNVFINDFTYLAGEYNNSFFKYGPNRSPTVHTLKVFRLSSDVNCHPIMQ